jgi:hypothetical protein
MDLSFEWSRAVRVLSAGRRSLGFTSVRAVVQSFALRPEPALFSPKSDPISLDTVPTTMTAAKEVDDERTKAEADSWQ